MTTLEYNTRIHLLYVNNDSISMHLLYVNKETTRIQLLCVVDGNTSIYLLCVDNYTAVVNACKDMASNTTGIQT